MLDPATFNTLRQFRAEVYQRFEARRDAWSRCWTAARGHYFSSSRQSAGKPIVTGWSYAWLAQLSFFSRISPDLYGNEDCMEAGPRLAISMKPSALSISRCTVGLGPRADPRTGSPGLIWCGPHLGNALVSDGDRGHHAGGLMQNAEILVASWCIKRVLESPAGVNVARVPRLYT